MLVNLIFPLTFTDSQEAGDAMAALENRTADSQVRTSRPQPALGAIGSGIRGDNFGCCPTRKTMK